MLCLQQLSGLREDKGIAEGVNTYKGKLTYEAVAVSQAREWSKVSELV